jgi:hypothetical protein
MHSARLQNLTAGTEPPGGWRSETQHELKRTEGDSTFTKALDSLVGSSDLLGGITDSPLSLRRSMMYQLIVIPNVFALDFMM